MFTTNKALIAGGGTMAASPITGAISWAFQSYLHMPQDIADGLATVLSGMLVGLVAYYVPNKEAAA